MTKKHPKSTVTRITRSISSKKKQQEKKKTKTPSTRIIYLTTKVSNNTQKLSTNAEIHPYSPNYCDTQEYTSDSTQIPDNEQMHTSHRQSSTKMTNIDNHQRGRNINHKRILLLSPSTCLCLMICVFLILVMLIAITIILVATLHSSTTTIRPTITLRWKKNGRTVAGILGQSGAGSNQLKLPWSLAIDSFYTLYIGDRLNNRIQKYLRSASNGITSAGQVNGQQGNTSSDLHRPGYIHLDSNGDLYIPDTYNQRIQLWSQNAVSGLTIAGTLNSIGNTTNQLNYPFGVTRDSSSGTLYIADSFNHRIVSYQSGTTTGIIIAGNKGPGTNLTQLWDPRQVYFDSMCNCLFIANRGANNIVRWVIGENTGTVIAGNTNGTFGNTSTSFARPTDITFDVLGNMYIADDNNHRIQFFPTGQSEGFTIAGISGISGNTSEHLFYPSSMVVDNQLNLYVADQHNHRIQLFERY